MSALTIAGLTCAVLGALHLAFAFGKNRLEAWDQETVGLCWIILGAVLIR